MKESTLLQLPEWTESDKRVENGTASPLDVFIQANEPAGNEDSNQFRKELSDLLQWAFSKQATTPDVSEQATNTESDEEAAEKYAEKECEGYAVYYDGIHQGFLVGCKHKAQQPQATNNNVDGLENDNEIFNKEELFEAWEAGAQEYEFRDWFEIFNFQRKITNK